MLREQLREQPHHDLAVLQHVGDAGGRARVVFQHIEGVGVVAHDVDAGDVQVDVVRHLLAVHLRAEHRVLEHQIFRHDAGAQHFTLAVDILEIEVERLDALLQSLAQPVPFAGREDARDDVERNEPFLRVGLAIDREGDADPAEEELGFAAAVVEHVGTHLAEPRGQRGIGRAHLPVRSGHLIKGHAQPTPPPARPPPNAADRRLFQFLQASRQTLP